MLYGLDAYALNDQHIAYAQQHLRMLSATVWPVTSSGFDDALSPGNGNQAQKSTWSASYDLGQYHYRFD